MLSYFCDKFLGAYGRMARPHRGRDRLVAFMSKRARVRWNSVRHIWRRGLHLESDFSVDNTGWILYSYGCLDYYDEREIRKFLRSGDVCFDVGAHIGYYSLLFSRWVEPTGRVYSYEPVPFTHSFLRRNLQHNRTSNVVVEQIAIGDASGFVRMSTVPDGRLGWSNVNDSGELETWCTTIDAEVERLGLEHLDFIKMDVEGYEMRAWEGATRTIKQMRPKAMFEVNRRALEEHGSSPAMLEEFFRSQNYGLFRAGPERLDSVTTLTAENLSYFNVFAMPFP